MFLKLFLSLLLTTPIFASTKSHADHTRLYTLYKSQCAHISLTEEEKENEFHSVQDLINNGAEDAVGCSMDKPDFHYCPLHGGKALTFAFTHQNTLLLDFLMKIHAQDPHMKSLKYAMEMEKQKDFDPIQKHLKDLFEYVGHLDFDAHDNVLIQDINVVLFILKYKDFSEALTARLHNTYLAKIFMQNVLKTKNLEALEILLKNEIVDREELKWNTWTLKVSLDDHRYQLFELLIKYGVKDRDHKIQNAELAKLKKEWFWERDFHTLGLLTGEHSWFALQKMVLDFAD